MSSIQHEAFKFKLDYNGKDITEDISIHLMEISYTDNVSGVSDDIEIKLEDVDGRWQNEWYPQKGANLSLQFGYEGRIIQPNPFEIDEIELNFDRSSGDNVTIKGIIAGISKQLYTKHSHAHENKTLGEIVRTIAARHGLTVIGNIANIAIGRVTQHREKDITFLNRLADEYGYAFTIKGKKLCFVPLMSLEGVTRVATIDKTDCLSCNIKDKSFAVYQAAVVRSHNPNKSKLVQGTATVYQEVNNDGEQFDYLKTGDNVLMVHTKTENEQQANAKSKAALHQVNSLQQTADISVPGGNPLLIAGNNIELTGFGRCSGIWHILKSTHSISKKDYIISMELKRIVPATQSGSRKTSQAKKAPANNYQVVPLINRDNFEVDIFAKRDNTRVVPSVIKK